jgi:hypothetical protein
MMEMKTIAISPEAQQALAEAQELIQSAIASLPPVRPVKLDQMGGPVPQPIEGSENASSVEQRKRKGDGVAAHQVRAGVDVGDDDEQLPPGIEDVEYGDLFLPGGGFNREGGISTIGGGESYLDRRLLSYYLAGMAENRHFLDTIDFHRHEEHWDGRYNFDHQNRSDTVLLEAESDREYVRQRSMADEAARLHNELQISSDLAASRAYEHQRALDDYHRYNSR